MMNPGDNKTLLLCAIIVITNALSGHFLAPSGILLTPFVVIAITSLIAFRTKNLRLVTKSILVFLLISLNDISLKLFAGGMHDGQGLGWMHFMLFLGLLPSFIILLISILANELILSKVLALLLFPSLIALHLYFFNDLGLGRYYSYSWN